MRQLAVKAPKFGPHGNFGPIFQKAGLVSLKRVLPKNREYKRYTKTLDLPIRFCSFFVHDSSIEATELPRKSPKFPWGPKLEAFAVKCGKTVRTVIFSSATARWGAVISILEITVLFRSMFRKMRLIFIFLMSDSWCLNSIFFFFLHFLSMNRHPRLVGFITTEHLGPSRYSYIPIPLAPYYR